MNAKNLINATTFDAEQTEMNKFRVVGDFTRMVYSEHKTASAATNAAKKLAKKWGWSHPGSEPEAQRLTDSGWVAIRASE
jgi:hypothetical protein